MAKNFVEEGKTVAIVASAAISSGDLVQVGDVFAVALTDIPQGETGDGMTEGVFILPKLKTDDMKTGKKVYLKSGKVQLSGLQRIEYLMFVQQRTAKFDAGEGELPEAERQIAFLRMGMDINAWLVSRSLWNAEQSQDVETLYASVITTWSYDALGAGAEMVLSLSGMGAIDNAGDLEHEVLTPEKS